MISKLQIFAASAPKSLTRSVLRLLRVIRLLRDEVSGWSHLISAAWPTVRFTPLLLWGGRVLLFQNDEEKKIVKHPSSFQAGESHQALKRQIVKLMGNESVSQVVAEGVQVVLRLGLWSFKKRRFAHRKVYSTPTVGW